MKKTLIHILLLLLISAPSSAIPNKTYDHVLAAKERMISSCYKTKNSKVRTGKVTAIMDFSHDTVFNALTKYNNYQKFLPFITHSSVASSTRHTSQVNIKAKIMNGLIDIDALVSAKASIYPKISRSIEITLIRGDLKRIDIVFTVQGLSQDKSILTTHFMIEPDTWLVSNKTLSKYNKVNARRTVRSLRAFLKGKNS